MASGEYATTYPYANPQGKEGRYPGEKKEPLPPGPPRDPKFPKPSKPVK